MVRKIIWSANAKADRVEILKYLIPDTERALLSRHNILFLGLRGQTMLSFYHFMKLIIIIPKQ